MDLTQYYLGLSNSSKEILTQSLERVGDLSKVNMFVDDILVWHELLHEKVESIVILKYAASEIQVAAFSLALGLYRQAFVSLRLSLELSLSSVLFSTNELEFREWQRGERDIYWSKIIGQAAQDSQRQDNQSGVFSQRYSKNFYPELEELLSPYNELAAKTYRKLSEFVHGNAETLSISNGLKFRDRDFEDWMSLFIDSSNLISFALCLRFLKQLNSQEIKRMENHLLDSLGHIPTVREYIDSFQ
jgi:hypothetical protein